MDMSAAHARAAASQWRQTLDRRPSRSGDPTHTTGVALALPASPRTADVYAYELQVGDTFDGATVTTAAVLSAPGGVVVEVDYRDQIQLPAYRIVKVTR